MWDKEKKYKMEMIIRGLRGILEGQWRCSKNEIECTNGHMKKGHRPCNNSLVEDGLEVTKNQQASQHPVL